MTLRRLALTLVALAVLSVASTALAAGTLTGKYKTTIKHDSALGGALNGTWVLRLTKGGYHVFQNGHAITHGTDTIKGHTITFRDTGGPGACPGTGKYKFNLTGNKLKFTLISDPKTACAGRKGVLTHGALTRVR